MKVYLYFSGALYEGETLLGAYPDRESALEAFNERKTYMVENGYEFENIEGSDDVVAAIQFTWSGYYYIQEIEAGRRHRPDIALNY